MEAARLEREQARVLALLKCHGRDATSFQILEPGYRYWFSGPLEEATGVVAYVDTGGAWVVAGAPIAPPESLGQIAAEFLAEAARRRTRVAFFAIERESLQAMELRGIPIGEQPVWDPARWAAGIKSKRSLREQLRRARAKGVEVVRLTRAELDNPQSLRRREIDALVARWEASRPMAPMGFLVQVAPFSFADQRWLTVAVREDRVVGLLVATPIYGRQGWFIEHVLRDPTAPNGTAELLIDHAMRFFAEQGAPYATLGLAPLAGRVGAWLRTIRRISVKLYSFEGLRAFKAKLLPQRWDTIYVGVPAGITPARAVYDVLMAFASGGPLLFGIRTLLRIPDLFLRLLAALLVPWTLVLALVDATPWFPSEAIRWAWVGFDCFLIFTLFMLIRRWRLGLAVLLAVLISSDAGLTLWEVMVWNLPRTSQPFELVVLAGAVAGPLGAAVLLWRGILQRSRWVSHPGEGRIGGKKGPSPSR